MKLPAQVRLRHVQTFLAIYEEGQLGQAAARLHLTQPAVSKTLADLESTLGHRLFERGRHGAQPTRAAEAFLPHARAVSEALAAAGRALVDGAAEVPETVIVGTLPTVAPDLVPAALVRFRAVRPQARVVVRTATNALLLQALRSGEVDLAVGRMSDPTLTVGLSFELLSLEPLTAAVRPGHPLTSSGHAPLARFLAYPLVICTVGTTPRQATDALFQSQGLAVPSNAVETLDPSVGRRILLGSDAVWLVPAGAIRDDVERGWLAALPLDHAATLEPVGLMLRVDAPLGGAAAAFAASLRSAAERRM